MGRKVNPIGFRLGINKTWKSNWFANGREYGRLVNEDDKIRRLIRQRSPRAGIDHIEVERFPQRLRVVIHTAKPGIIIGRRGAAINDLKDELEARTGITGSKLKLDVVELPNADISAKVVAERVAEQLERRVSQRRAMRRAMQQTMRAGAKGVKIACKGRLSGSEMGRRDWAREGRVPLHTLRADIDYACEEALTTFGRIGVKVWVYRGDVLPEREAERVAEAERA